VQGARARNHRCHFGVINQPANVSRASIVRRILRQLQERQDVTAGAAARFAQKAEAAREIMGEVRRGAHLRAAPSTRELCTPSRIVQKRGAQVKRGVFGMLSALNCVLPAGVVSAETVSDENIIMCLGMFMRDVVMPALYLVRARAPVLCMRLRWAGLRGIVGLRAAVMVCINLRPGARRHRGPRQPPCGCQSGYCRWQQ
jgi:hypothetical protein